MLISGKITCVSGSSSRGCSRPQFQWSTGSESSFASVFTRKYRSLARNRVNSSESTCCYSVALVAKKHKYFPGNCEADGGKAATPPIPCLWFHKISMFSYSFLMSPANAVLKLMSSVIVFAYVLVERRKSLSVSIMMLEYSFAKVKYDCTTLPMSGCLGP